MAFPLPPRRSHICTEEPGGWNCGRWSVAAASSPSPLHSVHVDLTTSSLLLQKTLGMCARLALRLHQNGMGHIPILHKRCSCLAVALMSLEAEFLNSPTHGVFVFCDYERRFLQFHSGSPHIQGNLTKTCRVMVTHI